MLRNSTGYFSGEKKQEGRGGWGNEREVGINMKLHSGGDYKKNIAISENIPTYF